MNHDGQKTRRTDIPGCVSYLSNFERLWSLANVAMIARIIGDVSKADLKQALDKVRYMHPLIGSRIIFDDRNVAWLSIDAVPETVLRIVSRTSETHDQIHTFIFSQGFRANRIRQSQHLRWDVSGDPDPRYSNLLFRTIKRGTSPLSPDNGRSHT